MLTSLEQRVLIFVAAFLVSGMLGSILIALGEGQPAVLLAPACPVYERNLTLGSEGEDVKALQKFLNARGFLVSETGAGSPGKETSAFGLKTRSALTKFQEAHDIAPAAGRFGPLTRAKAAALCVAAINPPAGGPAPPIAIGAALPPPAAPVPAATSTPPAAPPAGGFTTGINPRSIVGVLCFYKIPDDVTAIKGTGVIVNPEGYVLTVKHAVDPNWTRMAYNDTLTPEQKTFYESAVLDHCEVGLPENVTPLPTAENLETNSSSPRLITRRFQYAADVYFVPDRTNLSDLEFESADFAILKIKDAVENCTDVNKFCFEFDNFPYATSAAALPREDEDALISWGYPGEGRTGGAFYDFYLTGGTGAVDYYLIGNQRFSTEPLNFAFRTKNISTGLSGSPLFFENKLIGLLYGSVSESESYNLTISAIRNILQDHALAWVLKGE